MHNAWGFLCGAGRGCGSWGISRGKGVQIRMLQRRARHVIERRWREIITNHALYTLLCFIVSGTDYCNTPVSCYCSGFLMHQRHKTNCSAQNAESVECIFLSSSVHNIYTCIYIKKNTRYLFQKTTGLCQAVVVVKKTQLQPCLWPSKQVFQAKTWHFPNPDQVVLSEQRT